MPLTRSVLVLSTAAALALGMLAGLPAASAATAATASIERVSAYGDGTQVTGDSFAANISADGRHVVYRIHSQLWTLDRTTGARVRQDDGGTGPSGAYTLASRMTPDGRFIAFGTTHQLVPEDTNPATDIYLRDRDVDADGVFDETGATSVELVSVGPAGQASSGGNTDPQISDDGKIVTWHGYNTAWGATKPVIYLRDRTASTTVAATSSALYAQHGLSGDGRYLLWNTYAYEEGLSWPSREREAILLDRVSGTKTPIGRTPSGVYAYPLDLALSRNGRYVALTSHEPNIVPGDTNSRGDVFVIDRESGVWDAVGRQPDGTMGTTGTSVGSFSTDSQFVMFASTDGGLVAGDTNGQSDGFIRSLGENGVTARVAFGLNGEQPNNYVQSPAGASDGAGAVLFTAGASNLITGDTNSRPDAFVRMGIDLAPPPPTVRHDVTVTLSGTGTGTVSSTPAGIACPPTCAAEFDAGTSVTLTATPATGSTFTGFSGDCTGTSCSVLVDQARAVGAEFTAIPPAEPPVATDDNYEATAGTPLVVPAPGVLSNDSDPEGGSLSASVTTAPGHGTLDLNGDGSFTYTASAGYSGADQFTYEVVDAQGLKDSAVATIAVALPAPSDLIVWSKMMGGIWTGAPGTAPTQVVTGDAWYPSWSPDRARIAFTSDRGGQTDLWTVNADGSGLTQVTDNALNENYPAWSPDGSRIAFSRDGDGDYEIFTMRADGTDVRQLTSNTVSDSAPGWAPDGRRLVYESNLNLQIIDADGANPTPLVADPALWESGASWSPNGSQIAFSSQPFSGGGGPHVRVVNVDGTSNRPVTEGVWSHSPSWSPSGTHLAFTANTAGNDDVWVTALDGTGRVNVSNMSGTDHNPDWGQNAIAPPPPADLRVTATTGIESVNSGTNFTVSGTASNAGPGAAADAVLELTAAGASIVSATPTSCTVTSPNTASCVLGDLAAGQNVDYGLTLNAGNPGEATVTARLSCACDHAPVIAIATRTIVAEPIPASLAVSLDGPVEALQGEVKTYTFTVVNGLAVPANTVGLFMNARTAANTVLPISGTTTTHGSCSAPHSCQLGTLAAGATATVTIQVTVTVGSDFTVRGGVSCDCTDSDQSDNLALLTTAVTPRPDLSMTITNPPKVSGGASITWVATVTGIGDTVVRNLVVEYDIPAGIVVDRVVTGLNGTSPGDCTAVGNVVRCTFATATGSPRIYIVGTPTRGGTYSITGRIVSCDCVDPNLNNNTVTSLPCVVPPIADVTINKTAGQTLARVGDVVTWTIDVGNRGPDAAPGVTIVDPLPTGFTFVSATADQGSCQLRTRTVTCSLGTVTTDDPVVVTIQARASTQHTGAVNTAQVRCECWEPTGSQSNTSSAQPIRVEALVQPVTVTGCTAFTTLGSCHLTLYVPNANPTSIPSGVITIGPFDPTTGPRLDPDYVYPKTYTCKQLSTTIECRLTNGLVPSGGFRGLIVPLIPTSGSPFTPTVSWNCGCVSYAPVVTTVATRTPKEVCIGGQVLFDSNASKDSDIYAARLDGSGSTNLTDNTLIHERGAVWSPDSSRFVFDRGPDGFRKLWIAVLDSAGCIQSQYKVPGQPAGRDNYQPDWSPNGGRLTFVSGASNGSAQDIWAIGTDGTAPVRVTTAAANDRAPSFSKNGSRIAFASQRTTAGASKDWNIWTAAANGSGGEQFLSTPAPAAGYSPGNADYSPAFSRGPGPSRILWHSDTGKNWDLWLMNEDGTNKHRIPRSTIEAEKNGDWSADGTKIVYDAGTGSSGIWIMDAEGTNRRLVDEVGGTDQAPNLHTANLPALPCGTSADSGGEGVTTNVHDLGAKQGSFRLTWNAYSYADQFDVFYEGKRIYTTGGPVSGTGDVTIPFGPGRDDFVSVRVTGQISGTAWNYQVHCPQ